jgi:hypothetical protein
MLMMSMIYDVDVTSMYPALVMSTMIIDIKDE